MDKDDPQTIVDRLNGIYPSAVDAYPVSPIQKEAAREILRLRKDAERYRFLRDDAWPELCACINGKPSYISDDPFNSGKRLDVAIDAAISSTNE